MEIKRYDSKKRMSRVVEYDGLLYFGGHVAMEGNNTMEEQAEALLNRYEDLLEKFGSSKRHIISATLFMNDINLKPEFDKVWDSWIEEGTAPSRTCVQAKLADDSLLVELTLIAAKK